jgi:hypothetical protein
MRYCSDIVRASLTRERAPLKVLLLGDQASYTSEQQFAPLLASRSDIREQLGVVFHRQLLGDALALPERLLRYYDVVGLKLFFRTSAAEALRITRTIRSALAPDARLVYFDGDDDLCILWPEVLPLVDAYVKKHCFRDRIEYRKQRIGKSNLTDYAARNSGISFAEDIIPVSSAVDEAQLGKIVAGWNIGLDDKIRELHRLHPALPATASKDVDIVCRATVNRESWLYALRSAVIPKISSMAGRYKVLTPEQRVSQAVYYEEMLRSRVCVSPFGYGEICWRDFEAVLCGCVLVKPDMSHVETAPDIFVPDETYVPVRWDYADLVPVLEQLLAQPERCERLRANAFKVLSAYLEGDGIVNSMQQILRQLGFAPTTVPAAAE